VCDARPATSGRCSEAIVAHAARLRAAGFSAVALRQDDALLRQIVAARHEVRPFTDNEIPLLKNFTSASMSTSWSKC
jgi:Ser/Thr protein kinase RdoA (MazF antagonist)